MKDLHIEDVILRDSHRGMDKLRPHLAPFFARDAAHEILSWPRGRVLLTTGFYVAGFAETDGPAGTFVLAGALRRLGFDPLILTDASCEGFFEPQGLDVLYMPYDAGEDFAQATLKSVQPVGMISIERCGRDSKGEYCNMKGESIRSHTARADRLFELAYGRIPTIGIGDGGNEIGMGVVADVIEAELAIAPCRVRTDHLVIASVSNWGAYGVAAYLQQMSKTSLLPPLQEVREFMDYTVSLGSVDGILRRSIRSEDGYPFAVSEEVYETLKRMANGPQPGRLTP